MWPKIGGADIPVPPEENGPSPPVTGSGGPPRHNRKGVSIMHRKDAIAWVVSVCSVSLRLSQAKTLAILVAAAMRVQRISLANIGRQMLGSAKHQIKRCWRFCANERVESAAAMRGGLKKGLKT